MFILFHDCTNESVRWAILDVDEHGYQPFASLRQHSAFRFLYIVFVARDENDIQHKLHAAAWASARSCALLSFVVRFFALRAKKRTTG